MALSPVKGVNVLNNPSMLSKAHWGETAYDIGGDFLANDISGSWDDGIFADYSHVVDGGRNALLLDERTNDGDNFASGTVEFGNDQIFLAKAGQEWRVKFTWKRQTAENNRKRVRAIFKGALPLSAAHLTLVGPWSTIDAQFGTAGYDWTFTFPKWWIDSTSYPIDTDAWHHALETMFLIGVGTWNAGPQYPDYNITHPSTAPNFSTFDFQLKLFATDAHWTGGYTDPADTAPFPDPGSPPPVPPDPEFPTPTPAPGSYPENLCGVFDGEVFVDDSGTYIGNAGLGDGPGGPYGWVNCAAYCENKGGIFGLFRSFKDPPCSCFSGTRGTRVGIPYSFGGQSLTSVVDTSGPPGLEGMLAMQIDLPGTGESIFTWAGTQVYDETTGWATGLINGNPGWRPSNDEMWVVQFWVKAVPDDDGFLMSDSHITFCGAPRGYPEIGQAPRVPITDEWTFTQQIFAANVSLFGSTPDWTWPVFNVAGTELERSEDYPEPWFGGFVTLNGFVPKGRLLMKCPHLYPYVPPDLHVWANHYAGRDEV